MTMEIEHHHPTTTAAEAAATTEHTKPIKPKRLIFLLLNIILLLIGGSGSPLMLRVYFLHGGNRKWFTSFLQTVAFPFLLLPLLFSFLRSSRSHFFLISPFLLLCSIFIGLLTGIDNLFYSYGLSYLPVSTSSLLISTQLGFTAVFAFFIVKQKFTASSINAVVLLTFGAVVLGVHANGDRPEGESKAKYYIGFIMTLAAAFIYGLVLPLVELMYAKSKMKIGYTLVMEIQVVIGLAATAFCAVGMVVNKDFQVVQDTVNVGAETAAALKAQTEQMSKIVNELDSIHFSMKKASQLVKEIGRQVATDRCIMALLFLIVVGVIAIIIVKIVNPKNKDIRDIPGLAPPANNRKLLWDHHYYR